MFLRITCLKFTFSVVQFALCMHCARLLYKLHVNNGEIEVGPDFRQVQRVLLTKSTTKSAYVLLELKKRGSHKQGFLRFSFYQFHSVKVHNGIPTNVQMLHI